MRLQNSKRSYLLLLGIQNSLAVFEESLIVFTIDDDDEEEESVGAPATVCM